MAKKTLGYVQLEWTCPNCGTRNPGPQKQCASCGASQPDDVAFEQAPQEELITDEAKIAQAKAGPDIHCFYCGTRNPAGAETCSQCGGDLTQGAARASGQVLGAHRTAPAEPITCPACGTPNPPSAPKCANCGASLVQPQAAPQPAPPVAPAKAAPAPQRRFNPILLVPLLLLCCLGVFAFIFLSGQTDDVTARVAAISWSRSIAIEELRPVTRETWFDEIPAGGVVGVCTQRVHHTQDSPALNSEEVCGTPYTVDTGSGFGEVRQDCQYRVYADWCEYSIDEWQRVDVATLTGDDFSPRWPVLGLDSRRREGAQEEKYEVTFVTEGETYRYRPRTAAEYSQFDVGSRWLLQVNTFGQVVGVEPAP